MMRQVEQQATAGFEATSEALEGWRFRSSLRARRLSARVHLDGRVEIVLPRGTTAVAVEAFIARLQDAQVKTVVDVRELPLSRKKGFSKTAFCAALSAHGIAYLHVPALGCPKPIRNQYKVDGNWQTYTRDFLKHIHG